jgi:LCP family protein required for cell wall assembly
VARHPDTRTDSMVLVSINARHTIISMTSMPRDYVDIPLGNGRVWSSKVNGIAYALGPTALLHAFEATYRTKIDYYVELNMSDFGGLVQAIGGIDIVVPHAIYDPSIGFRIRAGKQHLDGNTALSYARSRHTTSDYDRAARQQQILLAIMAKLLNPKTKVNLPKVLMSLGSLKTSLPLADMATFFAIAKASARAKVIRKVLTPPVYATFSGMDPYGRGWIIKPNLAAMRAWIAASMRG